MIRFGIPAFLEHNNNSKSIKNGQLMAVGSMVVAGIVGSGLYMRDMLCQEGMHSSAPIATTIFKAKQEFQAKKKKCS